MSPTDALKLSYVESKILDNYVSMNRIEILCEIFTELTKSSLQIQGLLTKCSLERSSPQTFYRTVFGANFHCCHATCALKTNL